MSSLHSSDNNIDPRDHCNCPIRELCLFTAEDNVGIVATSLHVCSNCPKKVYGPCLGEQLDNPMGRFWCRNCDPNLQKNWNNIPDTVRNLVMQESNVTDVMDISIDDNDNPQLVEELAKKKVEKKSGSHYNGDDDSWIECIICKCTQLSCCLNKLGECSDCAEKRRIEQMKQMNNDSDNSSSDDDNNKKKNPVVNLSKSLRNKNTTKSKINNQIIVNEPITLESSQKSQDSDAFFFDKKSNSENVFSATKELTYTSSSDDIKSPSFPSLSSVNTINKQTVFKMPLVNNLKLVDNQSSAEDTNQEEISDSSTKDDIIKKSSDDTNKGSTNSLSGISYSLEAFSPMDFPFDLKDNHSDSCYSPSKRKFVFLSSTIYGEEFYYEMDRINRLVVTDKYSDGIKFIDETSDYLPGNYTGLSTVPELIALKTLTFPVRIWSGDRFKSDCTIILGLHLISSLRKACGIFPLTCKTNSFGLWNQDPSVKREKSVLLNFWNFNKVQNVDYAFTVDEIRSFSVILLNYWKGIHGENMDSLSNLKGNFITFKRFFNFMIINIRHYPST
jgi:hypothetical protein